VGYGKNFSGAQALFLSPHSPPPSTARKETTMTFDPPLSINQVIATMDAKAPLPSLDDQQLTWSSASTFARHWGLNQLADRLDEMA
jgi:hypothetical protein